MKRSLSVPLVILAAASVSFQIPTVEEKVAVDSFAGTWEANLARSQQHPNHKFQKATLVLEVLDDAVLLTFKGVNAAGKQESGTRKFHPDGKERTLDEAPGLIVVTSLIGPRKLESVAKKDGKVVGASTYELSEDGKTLTAKVTGTDASGAPFDQVIVFDRH